MIIELYYSYHIIVIDFQVHHRSNYDEPLTRLTLDRADGDIRRYTNVSKSFQSEQVVVITWFKMIPYPCQQYQGGQRVCEILGLVLFLSSS